MSLLEEIIELATDGKSQPSVLLRKLLVLAARLKNGKLKTWAEKELNGYGPTDSLPDYRVTRTESLGVFFGIAGSRMENVPLPTLLLKDEHRELIEKADFRDGIAAYQLPPGADPNSGQWQIPWSANLVAHYQSAFYPGQYSLKSAWQVVPAPFIAVMLDSIQNRVLMFGLNLQEELGPGHEDIAAIPRERVDRSVVNIIYGGHNVIAGSTGDVLLASAMTVHAGNFASLSAALERLGVDKTDFPKLESAVAEDQTEGVPAAGIGKRAHAWIADAAAKLAMRLGDAGLV
jgi:hypothetical protein